MKFSLHVRFGDKLIDSLEFKKDMVTIGRDPKCDVFIDNLAVSRLHAVIERRDIFCVLRDMGSDNGTYIRGQSIKRYNLNSGDEILIGKYAITFEQNEQDEEDDFQLALPGMGVETPTPELDIFTPAPEENASGDAALTMAVDSRQMLKIQKKLDTLAAYLTLEETGGFKRNVPLIKPIYFFGTHPQAEFPLQGWFYIKRHVILFQDGMNFNIVHMANKKPPMVNGREVDYHRLKEGDVITLANYRMIFHVGSP